MSSPKILLVEVLDAAGAAMADARAHAHALQLAGAAVRAVVIEAVAEIEPDNGPRGPIQRFGLDAARAALAAELAGNHPDLIVVASAVPGGGDVGRMLRTDTPVRWWPTGVATGATTIRPFVPATADAGFEWSLADGARAGRPGLSPWDGDYLLVAGALGGESGHATLRAFAAVAEMYDSYDLVVLAHPQPEFEQAARTLGFGMRVHFTDASPRGAESAWMGSAGALIVGGMPALSGGFVLRALAAGCPVVPVGDDAVARATRDWLGRHGLGLPGARGQEREVAEALERAIERTDAVERAIAAGKALVERHAVEAVGRRLVSWVGDTAERRAA